MRVLHVIAGADHGGAESIMCDAVSAFCEAGIKQHVITRAHNQSRIAEFAAMAVPLTLARFDKIIRYPTTLAVANAIRDFTPDVCHYWMSRAATFAPHFRRATNLGWYGGYYDLRRFSACEWHAGMTSDIVKHIENQGAPSNRIVVLIPTLGLPPEHRFRAQVLIRRMKRQRFSPWVDCIQTRGWTRCLQPPRTSPVSTSGSLGRGHLNRN